MNDARDADSGASGASEATPAPGRRHRRARRSPSPLSQWLTFLCVAAALFLLIWGGWSVLGRRVPLPYTSGTVRSDSAVTVGLTPSNPTAVPVSATTATTDASSAPTTLDIRTADSTELDRALIGNVYQTLLGRDENNKLTAGVASSWKTSADGLTLTLTLRDGLTFSNGDKLDSSDVVWSLQQAIEGKWPGAEHAFAALKSVANPDARTVAITLERPDATLPYTLSGRLGIVYDADATVDYATTALGSGPFIVANFAAASSAGTGRNGGESGASGKTASQIGQITLKARTDRGRNGNATNDGNGNATDTAKTGTVTLNYYADDAALAEAAKRGDVDLAVPAEAATAKSIADASNGALAAHEGASTRKVALLYNNDTESILSIPRVRQALRMIVDKQAVANGRADVAHVLGGPIGPLEAGYEDLTSILPHDVTGAKSMLTYFGSRYMGTFTLLAPTRYESLARGVADQMTAAGLKVDVQVPGDAQLAERVASRQFTLMVGELDGEAGTAAFADPTSVTHYTNATAQQQYQAAAGATSDDAHAAGLKAYARTVSEDAASDWLYAKKTAVAASTKLSGYPVAMSDDRLPLATLARR
ncbi:ABC transporter substrate-binding protein [Bifidobacterium rousetti]|uniref:ABC transporter substrate-binding protein n=1 Tax=Bifidobacterium rousetti TaxID=2045439 RepID=UPI00168AD43C|nr:ABC transporter substrate-binding protein [Bifidobacterium rousetti]